MVTTTGYHVWRLDTSDKVNLRCCLHLYMVTRSVIAIATEMGMLIIHGRVCCGIVNTVIISAIMRIGINICDLSSMSSTYMCHPAELNLVPRLSTPPFLCILQAIKKLEVYCKRSKTGGVEGLGMGLAELVW